MTNYQKLKEDCGDLDLQVSKLFRFKIKSHVKITTCLHITQNFHDMNKEHLVNQIQTFQCACNDTNEIHRLYFCVGVNCFKDLVKKKECNIEVINMRWMKFCALRTSLNALSFRGNMRFFNFNDLIEIIPVSWCYRYSLIFKK